MSGARDDRELLADALKYYVEHPYLDPGKDFQGELPGIGGSAFGIFQEMDTAPEDPSEADEYQSILDQKIRAWVEAKSDDPIRRWGLVPTEYKLSRLVSYMFLHAGWLHLATERRWLAGHDR